MSRVEVRLHIRNEDELSLLRIGIKLVLKKLDKDDLRKQMIAIQLYHKVSGLNKRQ